MKNLQSILGKQMCMYETVLCHMEKTILCFMDKAAFLIELGTITDYIGQGDVFCGDQRQSSPLVHLLQGCPISPLYFPSHGPSDFFLVPD